MSRPLPFLAVAHLVLASSLLTGCHSLGPRSVARDRIDYSESITESWKRQTLLNIVKLRYSDPPIFLDVGQIVAGYQFEGFGSAGTTLNNASGNDSVNASIQGRYIDRPTITYTPLTGGRFITGLVTPLSPSLLFSAIQAGWPADAILYIGTHGINGLANEQGDNPEYRRPQPEFLRAISLIRRLQLSGAVGIRVAENDTGKPATLFTFHATHLDEATRQDISELRGLLRLDAQAQEFQLTYGLPNRSSHEIAVQSRSLLNVLTMFSHHVEIPAQDITDGRASAGRAADEQPAPVVRIRSSRDRPSDAFVAVQYRTHWFWIDDRDLVTKRAFALIMLLFSMADTGATTGHPILTIPTG
jgi:hypothetical protein